MVGRQQTDPQSGFALVTALFTLILVSAALSFMAASLQLHMRTLRDEGRRIELVALADAALAETLANLAATSSYGGLEDRSFGNGRISSRVESLTRDTVAVVARAYLGGQERWIRAEVKIARLGPVVVRWQRIAPPSRND